MSLLPILCGSFHEFVQGQGDPASHAPFAAALDALRGVLATRRTLVVAATALEFMPSPTPALAEALRVARQGVILGVLNRHSVLGRRLKRRGGPLWGVACFFTPGELGCLVHRTAEGKQIALHWRTTLWPLWPTALPLPWGAFIGMAIEL